MDDMLFIMAASFLLCCAVFAFGWVAGNAEADLYRREIRQLKEKLDKLTDRDERGRYVK